MNNSISSSYFSYILKTTQPLIVGELEFRCAADTNPRIGFSVSKKYGNAVKRNLLKRHCRSAFKNIVFSNNSFVFSIIVRPLSKNICYKSILNSFFALNEKISN